MKDHKKLRAFELADEIIIMISYLVSKRLTTYSLTIILNNTIFIAILSNAIFVKAA